MFLLQCFQNHVSKVDKIPSGSSYRSTSSSASTVSAADIRPSSDGGERSRGAVGGVNLDSLGRKLSYFCLCGMLNITSSYCKTLHFMNNLFRELKSTAIFAGT